MRGGESVIRFRYTMSAERFREEARNLQQMREILPTEQVCVFLRHHGYHLDEKEVVELADQLFSREHEEGFLPQEAVSLLARLNVDEEMERELRGVFYFLSGGEEQLLAGDLRSGIVRLGEQVSEGQVNRMMKDMDIDGNGFLSFEAFLESMLIE